MKDVLPYIAELLGEVADVELAYPDTCESLPVITLTETDNSVTVMLSGEDRYSVITLQLDVYARDAEGARAIALQANGVLSLKGLKRSFAKLITDEKVPRVCMRYRFGIDEASGRVVTI